MAADMKFCRRIHQLITLFHTYLNHFCTAFVAYFFFKLIHHFFYRKFAHCLFKRAFFLAFMFRNCDGFFIFGGTLWLFIFVFRKHGKLFSAFQNYRCLLCFSAKHLSFEPVKLILHDCHFFFENGDFGAKFVILFYQFFNIFFRHLKKTSVPVMMFSSYQKRRAFSTIFV